MSYSNLSVQMSDNDVAEIQNAINVINQKMPFMVTLTPDERRGLFKLGPKSADFVQDAAMAAANFPNILPAAFNKAEFARDSDLFKKLTNIAQLLDALVEKVDDTLLAAGSEAMGEALQVYAYVQTAAGTQPGLKSVAEKLKDRFRSNGLRKVKVDNQSNEVTK